MEQQRANDRDRIWAAWMRAANAGDDIAYRLRRSRDARLIA
jgi:hypothetical protein